MTRQQHLQFCKVCRKRKFSTELGLICQLTEKQADFSDSCDGYEKDVQLLKMNQIRREESLQRKLKNDFTFGLNRVGIKNGIVAGIILLVIGLTWLVYGLTVGLIFWHSLVLIIMGIAALLIGIFNALQRAKTKSMNKNMQDDNILDN